MQALQARSYANDTIEPRFEQATATAAALELPQFYQIDNELPDYTLKRSSRQVPLIVRVNRFLRTALVTFCGLALLGYGLDVAASNEFSKLQGQARRLAEQNTELSAQLLRAISFQGIQASVVGRAGLRVPEQVVIVKEVTPPPTEQFKPNRHHLPLQSGY